MRRLESRPVLKNSTGNSDHSKLDSLSLNITSDLTGLRKTKSRLCVIISAASDSRSVAAARHEIIVFLEILPLLPPPLSSALTRFFPPPPLSCCRRLSPKTLYVTSFKALLPGCQPLPEPRREATERRPASCLKGLSLSCATFTALSPFQRSLFDLSNNPKSVTAASLLIVCQPVRHPVGLGWVWCRGVRAL